MLHNIVFNVLSDNKNCCYKNCCYIFRVPYSLTSAPRQMEPCAIQTYAMANGTFRLMRYYSWNLNQPNGIKTFIGSCPPNVNADKWSLNIWRSILENVHGSK